MRFGEIEQLEQPFGRDSLEGRRPGRGLRRGSVLVPGGHKPVRGHSDWQGTADDPPEEAAMVHRHQPGFSATASSEITRSGGSPCSGTGSTNASYMAS